MLKRQLYSSLKENHAFFDLINDYAADGYLFWDINKSSEVLIDAKLGLKLGLDHTNEILVSKLEKVNHHFFNLIISRLEKFDLADIAVNEKENVSIELDREKVSVHFSVAKASDGKRFVLASVSITDDFYRAVDRVSESLDLAIWQWNIKTNELIINEKWANIIGYTLEELQPVTVDTYLQFTHPDDGPSSLAIANDYLQGKEKEYQQEIRFRHKNGSWRWVLTKGKIASRTESGEIEWFIGSHLDITDRKIQEIEADTLALVPLHALNSILITDAKGRITFVNQSFEKHTGYKLEEVIGKKPGTFLQGENTTDEDIADFRLKVKSGKSFNKKILNYKKSGEEFIVSCDVDPIVNESNEIVRYISIQKDITQDIINQEYLAKFKNTLDQTKDCIFIFDDTSLQFTYVNQGAISMVGYSESELLQLHPYDIKPAFPEVKFRKLIKPLADRSTERVIFRTYHMMKNGRDVPVEVNLQFIRNEDITPHYVAVVKDITEDLEFEKQLKRLSLVAEKTTNLVVITDEKYRIQYVNKAFEEKSGFSLSEVIGKKPNHVLHGKDTRKEDIEAYKAGIKSLKPFHQEILNYSKAGEPYWVSITMNPIFDSSGSLSNYIAIENDISEKKQKEAELKESEERLSFVLKASEIGYWDWNALSGEMTVNDRWYEMLGYNPIDFEVSIDKWHALVHPDDLEKFEDIMKNDFPDPEKGDFSIELRARHKDGYYIWILDRGAVVQRDKSGSPTRVSGMHMEITRKKVLEKELETERNFLNKLISANALSLVVINRSGLITYANPGAENVLGLSKDEIETTKYNDPNWNPISLSGEPFPEEELPFVQVMQSQKAVRDIQHGLKWKDGSIKYISVTGGPFNYIEGEIEDIIFSVTDITHRVRTTQELQKTQNRLESILKDMSDVIWSIDIVTEKMIYITPSVLQLTGYDEQYFLEDFTAADWEELIYHQDKPFYLQALNNYNRDGFFEAEYRIQTKEKEIKWVLNRGKLVYEEGKAVRLDGIITDITKRKINENEISRYLEIVEAQNERLKNFAYIVSHNLRSHSANIQGLLDLVNTKYEDVAQLEYIKLLNTASDKLDDTLHHLNEVVSVVSASHELEKVQVSDVLEKFASSFENVITRSDLYFINEVSSSVMVSVVPAFFESIVTNLMTNAIKYCDPNKKESFVKISARNFNGVVALIIEDNGLGIDLDKYGTKLFGMYNTFHRNKDARGIGLFLTKNQVESMGGKIEVQSQLGIGTTFKVFLKDGNI